MQTNTIRKVLSLAFAASVAIGLLAACPSSSLASTRMTAAAKRRTPLETSHLLKQVQGEAYKVQKEADQLHSYLSEPGLFDPQLDCDLLDEARSRVNTMDLALHQLWAVRSKASSIQQKAINRIAPTLLDLTDTTQLAIKSFNRNRPHLYTSQLKAYTQDMYMQAKLIGNSVQDFHQYSNDRRELQQLRRKLNNKTAS